MAGGINKVLLHPFFVVIVLLSGSNKLLELSGISIPFIHAYMDDIFCMPFVLTLALWAMRKFILKNENYVLNLRQIVAAIIYCSVLFELILPKLSATYIADIFDIAAYISGGVLFQVFINKAQLMPSVSRAERKISNASSLV